jgi:hypothetical protein
MTNPEDCVNVKVRLFSQKGTAMDVSSTGVANSALYLQRAQSGLQGPLNAIKQEEQAVQVLGQAIVQATVPQATQTAQTDAVSRSGVGQVLDISA